MRVLHFNHTGVVSGAEHSLLTLVSVLGDQHELLLAAPDGDLLDRARDLGIRVIAARGSGASWRFHPWRTPVAIIEMLRAGAELRSIARRNAVDVVHANSVRAGLVGSVACALGGPPLVVHIRDRVGSGQLGAIVKGVIARRAGGLIAVSDFVASEWSDVASARSKLVRIHNPVDCAAFHPDAADGGAWRESAGIAAGVPVLAVVGQITPWKRQVHALETFNALRSELRRAQLVIAGDVKFATRGTAFDNPGYLRQLKSRIYELGLERDVHLLGERRDVPSIMRAADVLLAPAVDEPFGRAVGEALATGTPAVIASRGGSVEFLRDGFDGVVVETDDHAAWAAACRRSLELRRQAYDASRREHACRLLSKGEHARAFSRLVSQVVS
jgi:glycosyltransferase involved in cell wall biosynthesis